MYKIYDLQCTNEVCKNKGIELLDQMLSCTNGVLETINCKECHKQLGIVIPAPKGYMNYTENRCIQK